MQYIEIKGAREHNLKNVNLRLPHYRIIVFTGISGSGKSTLVYDTIYKEGQRRFIESLSPYARQFLGEMANPKSIISKDSPRPFALIKNAVALARVPLWALSLRFTTPASPLCQAWRTTLSGLSDKSGQSDHRPYYPLCA